jgi:hypothetical protein
MYVALQPLVALIAGILILMIPRLLNYIVAIYLIVIGILGLVRMWSPSLNAWTGGKQVSLQKRKQISRKGGHVDVKLGRNFFSDRAHRRFVGP